MRKNLPIVKTLCAVVLLSLGALACSSDNGWGPEAEVTVFDGEHFYYDTVPHRLIDSVVDFPEVGTYSQIIFHYTLRCPADGCDPWDRIAWVKVVQNPDTPEEKEIEVWRYITPYRLGASWDLDVTDLRPILSGRTTIRAYISTGVGPNDQYPGSGWLVDAGFSFVPGTPARQAIAVEPVWSTNVTYGDPNVPIAESAPPQTITYPEGATQASLRSFITGHGQGNADNCAEFCPRTHSLIVNGTAYDKRIWRDDCPETAVPDQPGTWMYPRAGWCPGAYVYVWSEDVAASFTGGQATVGYDVQNYLNSCRPDSPDAPICTGCVFDTSCNNNCCDFNGGNHTVPRYSLSTAIVFYK